jgi:hypothetical protein
MPQRRAASTLQYVSEFMNQCTKQIPYYVSDPVQPLRPTQRFMAVPESLYWLAPQAPLLAFMTPKHFVVVNVLLHFVVGFCGCLLLRRRFDLSPIAFLWLILLFTLNGHIIAHIGAGHNWNGYFYLPWFAAFVFDALERKIPAFETSAKISIVILFILLQGTIHLYMQCLMFLGLVFVFSREARRTVLIAGTLTVLLSAFRLVPAAMTLDKLKADDFVGGYQSVYMFFNMMVSATPCRFSSYPWEYNLYVSPIGMAFIFIFGILLAFRPYQVSARFFLSLYLPLLMLLILSVDNVYYQLIEHLPPIIPNTERVPSRFAILPLIFLLIIACARFQKLHQYFVQIRWLGMSVLVALAVMLVQLYYQWTQWRISSVERNFISFADKLPMPHLITLSDPAYLHAVNWSFLFSLLVLLVLLAMWARLCARQCAVISFRDVKPSEYQPVIVAPEKRRLIRRTALAVGSVILILVLAGEMRCWFSPEGLWVTYYRDANLQHPCWRGVNFILCNDFTDNIPVRCFWRKGFSSRWTGWLNVPRDDDYVFFAQSYDGLRFYLDGLRFYLDGKCIIDNWQAKDWDINGKAVKVYLARGLHPLMVEHHSHTCTGALLVRWSGGGIPEDTMVHPICGNGVNPATSARYEPSSHLLGISRTT